MAPASAQGVLTLPAGGSTQFTAAEPVAWHVLAPAGVDGGTIDAAGLYHAPTRVPPAGSVLVQATSNATGLSTAATVFISSTTANGTFTPLATTKTEGQTLIRDVDRDGIPDLLDIQGNVNFLKGRSDGTFAAPILANVGSAGRDGNFLADLNGDGVPDLIGIEAFVTGVSTPNLHVALGQGDGTFQRSFDRAIGSRLRDVAAADFNGDGRNDLALVDEAGSVIVMFNDASGLFFSGVFLSTGGTTPTTLRAGDLNGDGRPDLVVANRGEASIAALINQGGTFAPARVFSLGFVPPGFSQSVDQVELGDLNGDLFADLVVHHFQGTQSFLGIGDGTFSAAASTLPAGDFALGHADADGKLDLILSTATGADLYHGNGNGTFTRVGPAIDGYPASTIDFTEFNRDGNYDLAARVFDGERFVVATLAGSPVTAAPLSVEIRPHVATVNAALKLELHDLVRGTLDSRVNWFVNGIAGGDGSAGTISVVDRHTAIFTAPDPIGAITSVSIEARSALNAAVKDTIAVDLTNYHWVRLANGLTNLDIRALANAADASRVYAGTANGMFRSDDDGLRWLPASGSGSQSLPSAPVMSVAVDPANALVVYAGMFGKGIYKSTDGGATWAAMNVLADNPFTSLATAFVAKVTIAPYDTQKVIVRVSGVDYRSVNGGATWVRLGGPSNSVGGLVLDVTHVNVLYGMGATGFVRSADFGDTFTPFAVNIADFQGREIQVDPFDGNHLIVQGNPQRLDPRGGVAVGAALFETRDGGATWHSAVAGLPIANSFTFAFSPSTPGMLLVATDINGGPFLSTALDHVDFHDISAGLSTGVNNLFVKALAFRPRKSGEAAGSDRFFVGTEVGVFGSITTFLTVPTLTITPSNPTVSAGGSITFSAGEPVNWRVLAQPGVNVGTITSAGVYAAPARVPPSGLVTIVGESIATGARGTATIAIASSAANGTLTPVTALPVGGQNPIIDVDGDGIPDLVGKPSSQPGVEVRKGLGDGTFAPPIVSSFANPGRDFFKLGDINGDGLPDLIGVDTFPDIAATSDIHVALGVGGDKFLPFSDRFVALQPRDVALVDINGDAVNDLLVLDEGQVGGTTGTVLAMFNDGAGNFGAPIAYPTRGPQPVVMAARDINNDGQIDVVVGNNDGSISAFLNHGGIMAPAVVSPLGLGLPNFPRFTQIDLADLDEDGKLDLIASPSTSPLVTLKGDGSGHFAPLGSIAGTIQPPFAVGHFNGDAHTDLLVGAAHGVELWTGNGAGGFSFTRRVIDGPASSILQATEMNGDGAYDLVANLFDGQQFVIYSFLGGPTTARAPAVVMSTSTAKANVARTITLTDQTFGLLDDSVAWFVNGVAGGNPSLGTVQAGNHFTASYRAPDPLGGLSSVVIEARSTSRPDVTASMTVPLTNYRFTQLPVGMTNLDIRDLAYAADGTRIFAATTGGLFRSDDAGAHWQSAGGAGAASLPGGAVQSVAVDPANSLVVYAGTFGQGIYKSSDGGGTWSAINALPDLPFTSLASAVVVRLEVSRFNSQVVLAEVSNVLNTAFGLREGSYRSTDGGATWKRLGDPAGFDTAVAGLRLDQTSANVLVGARQNNHFVRSSNLGDTFSDFGAPATLPGWTGFQVSDIEVDPFDGNHLIVSGVPTTTLLDGRTAGLAATLIETRDGGATWHSATTGLGAGNNFFVRFSPATQGTVLATTDLSQGLFLSISLTDLQWHDIGTGLQAGTNNLHVGSVAFAPAGATSPGAFYVGTPNGVYTTAPPGLVSVPSVAITPRMVTVAASGTAQFSADAPVVWSLSSPAGVDPGTIDAAGLYHAPVRVPPDGSVRVQALAPATGARSEAIVAITSATANGAFTQATTISPSMQRLLGDVNRDGIPDLLELSQDGVQFRRGIGDGTFAAGTPAYPASQNSWTLGDVNGDRVPDLIGFNTFPFGGANMFIALADGNGAFTQFSSRTLGLHLRDVAVADFNGDGANDLALVDEGQSGLSASALYVLLNDGHGNFGAEFRYLPGGTQPIKVRAGDLNGDGRADLVVGNQGGGGTIAALINQGGVFADPIVLSLGSTNDNFPRFGGFELADLDEDGRLDLVVGTNDFTLLTFRGQGDGHFTLLSTRSTINLTAREFALGYVDTDKHLDLLLPAVNDSGTELYRGDGTGALNFAGVVLPGFSPSSELKVTELNGDGNYDLAGRFFNGTSFVFATFLGQPVQAVNHAPSFTRGPDQTKLEDAGAQTIAAWANGITPGPPAEAAQTLQFLVTNNNPGLFAVQPAIAANGTLSYQSTANAVGSALVTVRLKDNGGTASGGADTSPAQTFTIIITPVNDAPSFAKGPDVTVLEDAGGQTLTGWATNLSAGPSDESAQTLTFVVSNNNSSLFGLQPAIDASGKLTFTPQINANGSATITVQLMDNGGTANGGADTSAAQTFTINVTPVNDQPSFTKGANQSVFEDAGAQSVANWATSLNAGPNEASQTLSFLISNDNPGMFAVQPAIDSTGRLTYTPAANANGVAHLLVQIMDNGGTANGGVDTSGFQSATITVFAVNDAPSFTKGPDQTVFEDAGPQIVNGWATNVSAAPNEAGQTLTFIASNTNTGLFSAQPSVDAAGTLRYTPANNANGTATITLQLKDNGGSGGGAIDTSASQTFTITITPVNDGPIFAAGGTQTVLEDAGPQSVTGWATNIASGPNETGQALTFLIVSNTNPGLFAVPPAIDSTGKLTYTPAANANGSTLIGVQLKDDGGTANGGNDIGPQQFFNINVTAVNDVPSFTKGPDQAVLEDAGAQSVLGWATNLSTGAANESSQALSFLVSTNNTALFAVQPTINSAGTLSYTTAANATGSATVTVQIKDNGGIANGGVDTSAPQSFAITVTPVNDAPSFSAISDRTINEDAPLQTVTITSVVPGPASAVDEAGQIVTLSAVSSNTALVANPTITGTGTTRTLTFQPLANANGSATITVTASDGQGVNNTFSDAFVVTVNAVNDPPSFAAIGNQVVDEDAGAQTISITNISAGPANEAAQTVTFTATSSNTAIIPNPTITGTGATRTLSYQSAANANGTVTITVVANDGQSVNITFTRTFTITVNPVNDADMIVVMSQAVNPEGQLRNHAYTITAINAGPDTATNVLVSATIPAGTTFQSSSITPLSTTGGKATWSLGSMVSGQQVPITMVVFVTQATGSAIVSTGQISSNAQEVNAGNNFFTIVTSVVPVGTFVLTAPSVVEEQTPATLSLAWTVPGGRWRELKTVDLRLRDALGTILWVRFDEAANTLSLFNPHSGKFGPPGTPGSTQVLANSFARIDLSTTSVNAAGPTAPTVNLNLGVIFGHLAAGRTYQVEVAATDDLGNSQDFTRAGEINVALKTPPAFAETPLVFLSPVEQFNSWLDDVLPRVSNATAWAAADHKRAFQLDPSLAADD